MGLGQSCKEELTFPSLNDCNSLSTFNPTPSPTAISNTISNTCTCNPPQAELDIFLNLAQAQHRRATGETTLALLQHRA